MWITDVLHRITHPGRELADIEISDQIKSETRTKLIHLYNRLEVIDAEVRLDEARQRRRNHHEAN